MRGRAHIVKNKYNALFYVSFVLVAVKKGSV